VFSSKGSGTVVTGTLTDGAIAAGDPVVIEPGGRAARVRVVQTTGTVVAAIEPGHRVALNLAGVEHTELARGDVVVAPGRWRTTERIDASLTVLASLDHVVSRRGAYVAYVGSGEHAVRLRVLGPESLLPGETGAVRLHLPVALPLLPGDRYVLRESGRDETVGGGEVLDVAPLVPASRARPDRDVDRVVAERGWVDVDELELLTGERREPTVGRWVAPADVVTSAAVDLAQRLDAAGAAGLDVSTLDDRQRAVLATLDDVVVDGVNAHRADRVDPLDGHPAVAALAAGGLAPPEPAGIERSALRELARRGVVVERDGLWFHADAVTAAGLLAAELLRQQPAGFTVGTFREAAGITRKHAVPLLAELDARGVTRRRDDLRIAGNRLPSR
jgi:selenocysteine-specific elongation factor